MPTRIVAPSLLSADFAHLGAAVQMLNESQAEWIHLDVMDGVFVPNISFGFPIIKAVRALTQKVLDAHLMIVEPDKYLARFAEVGVQYLTVHYEVCPHLHRTLSEIRRLGMKAGVAINPHTPPEVLEYSLQEADLVLVMSVNPGFGGQHYIPHSTRKVHELANMIQSYGNRTLIEVDGGITPSNANMLWEAGANILVAGNAVFGSDNPKQAIANILEA